MRNVLKNLGYLLTEAQFACFQLAFKSGIPTTKQILRKVVSLDLFLLASGQIVIHMLITDRLYHWPLPCAWR